MSDEWKIYNHAYLPTTPPHKEPNLTIFDNIKWNRNVFLARYTTDFDCGFDTNWWWLIKDSPIDISKLKKKRRYEITSGMNNFEVRKIDPIEYSEHIYSVHSAAVQNYKNSTGIINKESFFAQCDSHKTNPDIEYYGGFDKETKELAGYAINRVHEEYVDFSTMKFDPKFLSKKISAAMIYTMLNDYIDLQGKKYVSDGERSILHQTNFQDYLVKYFEFRKAYCRLNVKYSPVVGVAIKILYPFRKILKYFDSINIFHSIVSLLNMEDIMRKNK